MVENTPRNDGIVPALIFLIAIAVAIVLVVPLQTVEPSVFFIRPDEGETVPATFTVRMGTRGLKVEPAGEVHDGAGHFHILIDTDFIPAGQVIPNDEQHRHFGTGATETQLTLPPGEHILRLQFADGVHTALEYRDEIQVTVTSDE